MSTVDALTDEEREKLAQLQAVTNSENPDIQISLLQSVEWDVQAALQAIYGDGGPTIPPRRTSPPRTVHSLEIDDSHVVFDAQTRPNMFSPLRIPARRGFGTGLFSLLVAPLSVLASVLHFVFRVLRIPFPRMSTLGISFGSRTGAYGSRGGRRRRGSNDEDPSTVAERWVLELEEETGALCVSKAALIEAQRDVPGLGEGGDESNEPGPSSRPLLVRRRHERPKTIPDFFTGGFDLALKTAEREARVLCVILTSEEHDDSPAFRRDVLTNTEFVNALTDNRILCWGGDVSEKDGYQTAIKLGATTYPFVAFIALYARANRGDAMTVISRHSGPSTTITSAESLTNHLRSTVLPRVAPVLNRRRAEQQAREYERRLRQEQDRAYEESQRKDYEKIMKRREEERKAREEEERQRAEAAERERLLKQQAEERLRQKAEKTAWRRYARRAVVPPELNSKASVPIRFRMPSGQLVVRRFEPTDTITGVYAFVASQFIPRSEAPEDDPIHPPGGVAISDVDSHDWDWDFRLAITFPKSIIAWTKGEKSTVGDVSALRGGGNVVVEKLQASSDGDNGDESPATEEEDDEEETPSEDEM
ncbi:SubName: Full=Uncharacterized protein {ECO:0000313/EMBL:CCA67368.1} [Serendipita indica DSM 11827]|nr:SubName: Full=Uncharacterized protein {ECO:0000313/EMBL:CCA67368.1} [Serendipita indica DSM 11827]